MLCGCSKNASPAASTFATFVPHAKAPASDVVPKNETSPEEVFIGLEKDAGGKVVGSAKFEQPLMLMAKDNGLRLYESANEQSEVKLRLTLSQNIQTQDIENGWAKATVLPGMQQGYMRCEALMLNDEETSYYAEPVQMSITNEGKIQNVNLVDVRQYVPNIEVYIVFATPDNYTGKTLYARDVCLLEKETAEKLAKAQALFEADGYRIKIYDGYRPSTVSGTIYDFVGDGNYAASYGKSMHNRGAAVDITLVNSAGEELIMPSGVMELNTKANRNSEQMSAEAKENMDYMTGIMLQCGFRSYTKEWWHYNDSNCNNYPPTDVDLSRVTYAAAK